MISNFYIFESHTFIIHTFPLPQIGSRRSNRGVEYYRNRIVLMGLYQGGRGRDKTRMVISRHTKNTVTYFHVVSARKLLRVPTN